MAVDKAEVRTLPIPQADDLDKIFAVVELVAEGHTNTEEVASALEVVERQAMFYLNAAVSLRALLPDADDRFVVSTVGQRYLRASNRKLVGKRIVLSAPIVEYVVEKLGYSREQLATAAALPDDVMDVTKIARVLSKNLGISGVTPVRRAYTIRAWLKALSVAA